MAACSVALAGCFGNGVHRVGSPLTSQQMPPGLWRSLGGSQCSWARVGGSTVTGTSTHTNGPQYVQIQGSDVGLTVDQCLPFWQDPGPFARPLAQPGSPFGDGDFLVGSEVAAGTYSATFPPGQRCSWANVRGFHGCDQGHNPDANRSGSSTNGFASVLISPFDYGFTSQGCGQWQPMNLPPAPGGASTSGVLVDGVAQDLPDPYTLRIDDPAQCGGGPAPCYYTFSTESGFLGLINVPVVRSSDLVHWTWAGPPNTSLLGATASAPGKDAMPVLAPWAQFAGNWAPSVVVRPNNPPSARYVMYYTARSKDNLRVGRQGVHRSGDLGQGRRSLRRLRQRASDLRARGRGHDRPESLRRRRRIAVAAVRRRQRDPRPEHHAGRPAARGRRAAPVAGRRRLRLGGAQGRGPEHDQHPRDAASCSSTR